MKAAELICEEPFADHLAKTMSSFLVLRFGGEWRVGWNDTTRRSPHQQWLVNFNINAGFQQGVQRDALEVARREFGTSVVRWKRPFQRVYFWLATAGASDRMAHGSLDVDPPVPEADRWLIVPGTHKIRFIDSQNSFVYCCRKSGSSSTHFERELEARRYAERLGIPVPPIVRMLSADCIVEPLILGTPLNRLTSREQQKQGFNKALRALEPLYRATQRKKNISSYATHMLAKIDGLARSVEAIASSHAQELAVHLNAALKQSTNEVGLVQAHGDFQPGNLLYDRGSIWLIDWEYSAERQMGFDRMTYELRARFAAGLDERIAARARACSTRLELDFLRLFLLETILFECESVALKTSTSYSRSLISKIAAFEAALPLFPGGIQAA